MKCKHCGAMLKKGNRYCLSCGSEAVKKRKWWAERPGVWYKRRKIIVVVGGAASLLVALLIVLGLTGVLPVFERDERKQNLSISMDKLLGRYIVEKESGMTRPHQMGQESDIEHAIFNTVTYRIVRISGSKATIEIKVVDMSVVTKEVFTELEKMGIDDYSDGKRKAKELFIQTVEHNALNKTTRVVDIEFEERDGRYVILANDELYDAIYGGLIGVFDGMEKSLEDAGVFGGEE